MLPSGAVSADDVDEFIHLTKSNPGSGSALFLDSGSLITLLSIYLLLNLTSSCARSLLFHPPASLCCIKFTVYTTTPV